MRRAAVIAVIAAALALSGCGQTFEEKQAETLAAEPKIAPGLYGNVLPLAERGGLTGIELRLDQGSDSREIAFVRCDGGCPAAVRYPVRRGLGGVAFTTTQTGVPLDISVQPDGDRAVIVSADWGTGLQQTRLVRIDQPVGLAAPP